MIWSKTYGGILNEGAFSIQATNDNNYIIAGYAEENGPSDFLLMKIDPSGVVLWEKTFGGIFEDKAYNVKQTIDGGYIIGGWTKSYGSGREDMWIIKTDQNGNSHCKALYTNLIDYDFDGSIINFITNVFRFIRDGFSLL